MALWMKKRMAESQRKNGLNEESDSSSLVAGPSEVNSLKTSESELKYNCQSMPSTISLKKNENVMRYLPVSNVKNQQYQQNSVVGMRESKRDVTNIEQLPSQSDMTSLSSAEWKKLKETKNIPITVISGEQGDTNVLPEGAYYDEPVFVDQITYEKPLNYITQSVPMNFQSNSATPYRCTNANCTNCKANMRAP